MLKINELNKNFKEKIFSSSYNKLLGYAQGIARIVDIRDAANRGLIEENRKLKVRLQELRGKYLRKRNPQGRFIKSK